MLQTPKISLVPNTVRETKLFLCQSTCVLGLFSLFFLCHIFQRACFSLLIMKLYPFPCKISHGELEGPLPTFVIFS